MTRLWSHSLLVRLTVLFSLAALVVLVILGFVIANAIESHFVEEDYRILSHQMDMIEYDLKKMDSSQELNQQLSEILSRHGVLGLITTDAGDIFSSHDVPATALLALKSMAQPLREWHDGNKMYRMARRAFTIGMTQHERGEILAALDISHHEVFLASFHKTMWILIAATAACLGIVSWVVARIVLRPLRHIAKKTSQISAENLSLRIPIEAMPPDMKELVQAFNAMLDKLEVSFTRLSEFSHDLAHELRTPLSTMRVQTQVTLSSARTAEEYREVLQSNAEELDHLSRMVDNILYIAKTENGLETKEVTRINLEEEFLDLVDFYEALAESRDVRFALTGHGSISGDRTMLRRAFSNVVSNAIKYSLPSSVISVDLQQDDNHTTRIAIANHGESLAPEHLPRLFDRFYRVTGSTVHCVDGTGLGLAITRTIIHAHGGTITVQSAHDETVFTIVLPVRQIGMTMSPIDGKTKGGAVSCPRSAHQPADVRNQQRVLHRLGNIAVHPCIKRVLDIVGKHVGTQ